VSNEQKASLNHQDIPIENLIPYARNARIHTDGHIAQLAASIREFGFKNPILVDAENNVIAGHGRLLAARKLEMESAPCVVIDDLSAAQKRAFILADNKLHDNSSFDYEMLQIELDDLKLEGFDLNIAGFENFEISSDDNSPYNDSLPEPGDSYSDITSDMWGVIVTLKNEEEQVTLLQRLVDEGYKCKALI